MGWAEGDFSDELSGAPKKKISIKDAIGKSIVCFDGIPRRVVEIVHSFQHPWFCIINENDPESNMGHFVSYLSLGAQLIGQRPPDKNEENAFIEAVKIKRPSLEKDAAQRSKRKSPFLWTPRSFGRN